MLANAIINAVAIAALVPGGPAVVAQTGSTSIAYLCNETSAQIVAQYTLAPANGQPLTLTQGLDAISGKFGATATCFPLRIPNYTGPITFTGTLGNRHFPTKQLMATYDKPLYVWFYNEGTTCWTTTATYKACLEL
jgi:hypothetical protein